MAVNYRGKKFYNIGPRCQFHKCFAHVTYWCSKKASAFWKHCMGGMHAIDVPTYFAKTVTYKRKIVMKLSTGDNFNKLFMTVINNGPNKLERLFLASLSNPV